MSWLSDIVRVTTGKSVGESAGSLVGAYVGGPTGAVIGEKIGGKTTELVSRASNRSQAGQAVAVDAAEKLPSETSMSGEAGAGMGGASFQRAVYRGAAPTMPAGYRQNVNLPAIVGGAVSATRGIGGMLGLAGGALLVAPTFIDPLTGEEKKLRVTRRLRSQVKKAVEMFGVEAVADQMGVDVEVIFYILTKKMRNDGPYVTKAAVRKTRQTVRKMKHLCDMYDDLRPAAKRRAPARASSRTRVVNVK